MIPIAELTTQQHQLAVTLVALVPKDGTPMRVSDIASASGAKHAQVVHLLFEAGRNGMASPALTYDRASDTFFVDQEVRHGSAA